MNQTFFYKHKGKQKPVSIEALYKLLKNTIKATQLVKDPFKDGLLLQPKLTPLIENFVEFIKKPIQAIYPKNIKFFNNLINEDQLIL